MERNGSVRSGAVRIGLDRMGSDRKGWDWIGDEGNGKDRKAMDKLLIESALGVYVYGQGKEYLDFTSGGIFQAPFGAYWQIPGYPLVAMYGAHYDTGPAIRLRDMLKEWTGYESVVLFNTGAEATEAFWRVCRVYTGKPGIWGGLINPDECGQDNPLPDAMHGMTLGALIMAGKMRLPNPGMFKELGAHYEGQTYDATGCAIFEPYHAVSAQFHKEQPTMKHIRENIKTFPDIHFCCDEIQSGLGRTGKLFALEWYEPAIRTEFVTIGKMLGGGLPLSALLGPKDILEDALTLEHAHLHSTHSGNPFLCNVGCAVVERMQHEDLIHHSLEMGSILADELKNVPVRVHAGKGLLAGLEMAGPLQASKVVLKCREKGLLVVDTGRKWVKLGPPLTIEADDVERGCKILKEAVQEVLDGDAASCGDEGGESVGGDQAVPDAGVQGGGEAGDIQGAKDDGPAGAPV